MVNPFLTVFYIVELALRFYFYRSRCFVDSVQSLDFLIIESDVIIELGLKLVTSSSDNFGAASILRVFRLSQVARALRIFRYFRDLI